MSLVIKPRIFLSCVLLLLLPAHGQVPPVIVKPDSTADSTAATASKKEKPKGKSFNSVVEDFERREGLFTLYYNAEKDKLYLEVLPAQFDKLYLMNLTRDGGDGVFFDGGAMIGNFAFLLRRVGEQVQLVRKNLRFRADQQSAIRRAIERDIPNSIFASAKVLSAPHPERGSLLIDANSIFISDVGRVAEYSGRAGFGYSLDKSNSWITAAKSFPGNTEVSTALHFKSSKPTPAFTLSDSRSMIHRYHFSLSDIQESDYRPRNADDRIGHFYTLYQDYSSLAEKSAYRRVINRWHLEKSEPGFQLSAARQPIVIWLENTIPLAYRDAVRQGILTWNKTFREIGFNDPLVVKQMPDDADWDPADSRYNVVRWIVQPGAQYAVGNFRANPFNGQIYDADIRISADVVRFFSTDFEDYLLPFRGQLHEIDKSHPFQSDIDSLFGAPESHCSLARGLIHQLQIGWHSAVLQGKLRSQDREAFIKQALIHLTAHEVGHILGLRHNFKGSTLLSRNELVKRSSERSIITGSLMDYMPVNLAAKKIEDVFFQTEPGPYDYWAIAYAYSEWDQQDAESEAEKLRKIARRANQPELAFGTDEDAFAFSARGIDPAAAVWELGNNSIEHYDERLKMVTQIWKSLPDEAGNSLDRYPELREVFAGGVMEYMLAGLTVSKWLGGIEHRRHHPGDPDDRPPMQVVSSEQQQAALDFLITWFYSKDSFQFDWRLLNQLAPERFWDFQRSVFRMQRLDYPIHGIVQAIQAITLFRIYHPVLLMRLQDNEVRVADGKAGFTLVSLFRQLHQAIWTEVYAGESINSYRRELQRMHLYLIHQTLLNRTTLYPHDVIALNRFYLTELQAAVTTALKNSEIDTYTRAHLQYIMAKIEAVLNAEMVRSN